jgi:hypothetical protein
MTILEVSLKVLRMILDVNLKRSQVNNEIEERVLDIYGKLKPEMKDAYFTNTMIDIYVKNIEGFKRNPAEAKYIYFSEIEKAYWFRQYLRDNPTMEEGVVFLVLRQYDRFTYECTEYLHYLMSTIRLTNNDERNIHFPKLDSILSEEPKKYAKHARQSVTQTLLGINQQKMLRPQPDANGMIQYKKAEKYTNFGDSYINCKCPICSTTHKITMTNFKDKVSVKKDGEATFKCNHSGDFLAKMPFRINIKNYLPDSFDEQTAIIYFLVNLKKFSVLHETGQSN